MSIVDDMYLVNVINVVQYIMYLVNVTNVIQYILYNILNNIYHINQIHVIHNALGNLIESTTIHTR